MKEKNNIASLFDHIADTYDRLNHLLSLNIDRYWRRKSVKQLSACESLLDVAVGTADLSIEIARQQKAEKIVGVDISEEMMQIGRRKIEQKKLSHRITLLAGNALQLPFEDDAFDAVACAYGVRNFSNLEQGLGEMWRVLKPGGQLLVLEFSYPKNPLVRRLYDAYFTRILPKIGKWVSKDKTAYTYLCQSVKNFIWGEEMTRKLAETGFQTPEYRPLTFGITTIYTARK